MFSFVTAVSEAQINILGKTQFLMMLHGFCDKKSEQAVLYALLNGLKTVQLRGWR